MKKKYIFFLILFFLIQKADAKDYYGFCSRKLPSKTAGGLLTSLSGANYLSSNIIKHEIKKALKRETGANFTVDYGRFFGLSPLKGAFYNLNIYLDSNEIAKIEDINFSDIKLATICPYNEVVYKDKKIYFSENAVFEYSAEISKAELDKLFNTFLEEKAKFLKMLKQWYLTSPEKFDYTFILPYITKFSPLSFKINFDENKGKLIIENIKTKRQKVFLEGKIVFYKSL